MLPPCQHSLPFLYTHRLLHLSVLSEKFLFPQKMAITGGGGVHNWSVDRDSGVLSPKWDIYITPFPVRGSGMIAEEGQKNCEGQRDKR